MGSLVGRTAGRRWIGVILVGSLLFGASASSAVAATTLPALWTAGGLSAGSASAGQAAWIAADASGNVAVVSGPALARDLAVTSYTASGQFRWRSTISPSTGTFRGGLVVAAPNGDFVAVGYTIDSHGYPRGSTVVRYGSNGTFLWRVDLVALVARLVVDAGGNAYLAFGAQDVQVHKYNPSGALLWATGNPMGDPYSGIAFIAQSLALSPDQADVVLTGDRAGGATWITAAFNATTGARKWLVTADEGIAARDVVVDATRVYVTGEGNVGVNGFLTVVAYDRATGARLWRTDANPPTCCAYASRIALAPDGSLVVAGQTSSGGYFDWWIVAMSTSGAVRWQVRRDAAVSGDEIPAAVLVLADGTTVVSGTGGPVTRDILGNSYMQGVTAGYSPNGTLLWEAFSKLPTAWATALPNGDVCATGGYDALITCFRVSGVVRAVMTATPSTGTAPLSVTFDGSGSTTPSGTITSWAWSFGDGASGTGPLATHVYSTPGTYAASVTVTDSSHASSTATGSIVVKPLPPAAPSGLLASLSGNLVQVAWQDNSSNETLFYIERCQGVGCTDFGSFVATQWPNVSSYTDYAVVTGQSYSYRVRAYNAGGYSPYSNIASIVAGAVNQPPNAVMSATPTSGSVPLAVSFSSAGSSDPNGTIASYAWSFGDGGTSTLANPSHNYQAAGTFAATLTVTDNQGATAAASTTITVTQGGCTSKCLRSTNISLSAQLRGGTVTATGQVTVKNENGAVVSGAKVSARWTLPNGTTVSQTATANSSGLATFKTSSARGTYALTITNITKTGYTFDPAHGVLSKSITR